MSSSLPLLLPPSQQQTRLFSAFLQHLNGDIDEEEENKLRDLYHGEFSRRQQQLRQNPGEAPETVAFEAVHDCLVRELKRSKLEVYKEQRPELILSKFGITFECDLDSAIVSSDGAAGDPGVAAVTPGFSQLSRHFSSGEVQLRMSPFCGRRVVVLALSLVNGGNSVVTVDSIFVMGDEQDEDVVVRLAEGQVGVVAPGGAFRVHIEICKRHVGRFRIPLMARLTDAGGNQAAMTLELAIHVETEDMRLLEPVSPFVPIATSVAFLEEDWPNPQHWSMERGVRPEMEETKATPEVKVQLPGDRVNYRQQRVLETLNSGKRPHPDLDALEMMQLTKCEELLAAILGPHNYLSKLQLLLRLEQTQAEFEIKSMGMKTVTLSQDGNFFWLSVPGLAENRPSLLKDDRVYIHLDVPDNKLLPDFYRRDDGKPRSMEGFVHEIRETRVRLGFGQKFKTFHKLGYRYNVRFDTSRFTHHTMMRAVDFVNKANTELIEKTLFPTRHVYPVGDDDNNNDVSSSDAKFVNKAVYGNAEQRTAVTEIVSGRLVGAPYIIWGPPGTGKTVTIVEAMVQLYKKGVPELRILACAPSNSAADVIADRLLENMVKPEDILRLYATARDKNNVPASLFHISNFNPEVRCSNLKDIKEKKIIVCTMMTSGQLVSWGITKSHFSNIFLDEAGYAQEPEALVPLSGLFDPARGKLVVSGDPKQLGPVLQSHVAQSGGLKVSLMERLMDSAGGAEHYQRRCNNNYDHRYMTKLLDNYRSHLILLTLPNHLFYDNELRCMAVSSMNDSGLYRLCGNKTPLVFHAVPGVDRRESTSPSYFNSEEVCVVVDYVTKLITKLKVHGQDIGVITPYRRQVQKIRDVLERKLAVLEDDEMLSQEYRDVTVGSVEQFQGQERRIVIISTVRSSEEFLLGDEKFSLGFLRNEKRFNVAITRAKALMVVVGNPKLLYTDNNWKALVDYAHDCGGYVDGGIKYTQIKKRE